MGTSTKSWEEFSDQSKDDLLWQCAKAPPWDLLWEFCPAVWLHLILKKWGKGGMEEKPNAQSQQVGIPLNPLLGFWRRNTPKGPAAPISELKAGQKDCNPLMPINPVSSRTDKFYMETSFEDSWVTCCFPPPSGKLLLIILGGTVGQSSACQMHHACHLETLAKLTLLLASIV